MKKIILLALSAVLMTACALTLPGQFTELADKVAAKGADYTPKQWEKANAQFEKLVQRYEEKYETFSADEKKQINAAIGKYMATALKCGVSDSLKQAREILNDIPSAVGSATEGVKSFLEELGL